MDDDDDDEASAGDVGTSIRLAKETQDVLSKKANQLTESESESEGKFHNA